MRNLLLIIKMAKQNAILFIFLVSYLIVGVIHCQQTGHQNNSNLAKDLMNTAASAGYNLTMDDIDLAANAKEDEEIAEALPSPVAEKLIGHRQRDEMDVLRDQMIGMIFTGKPQSLGYDHDSYYSHRPATYHSENRRRFRTRPKRPSLEERPRFHGMSDKERPSEILKPIPFVPRQSNIAFPMPPSMPSEPRPRRPRPRQRNKPLPHHRQDFQPNSQYRSGESFGSDHEVAHSKDIFSNHVGPDFGPVTFEEFGADFPSPPSFGDDELHSPNDFHHKPSNIKPQKKPSKHPSGFSSTKFGNFDVDFPKFGEIPKFEDNFSNFGHHIPPNFDSDLQKFESPPSPSAPLGEGYSEQGRCHTYTEDICIDTDNYPHEAILSSLAGDPSRTDTLMAEVKDQSADILVDGVSAVQESKYNFAHYFGNRRQDQIDRTHRDFAQEGGYLCPSEVKYARPKRARNSKGKWKFIVNMDKYTQTIRMEKCMKPGGTCSYVSHHYRAMCNQIYNYQRLLSWEKKRGLHMDIFKVPSCCSCHIQGYAYVFPPLHKSGSKTSRSDTVAPYEEISSPEYVEDINKVAPPYSPVNYPNISEERGPPYRRRNSSYSPRNQETRRRPTGRRERRPSQRNNQPDKRVNYGYHPIIDFFERRSNR